MHTNEKFYFLRQSMSKINQNFFDIHLSCFFSNFIFKSIKYLNYINGISWNFAKLADFSWIDFKSLWGQCERNLYVHNPAYKIVMFMMIGSTDIHLITLKSPKLDGKKDCLMKSRIYYTNQKFGTLLFVARKTLPFLQLEALSWSHKFSACFTLIHTLSWS